MVSAACLLGRRSSNPYDPAYSPPSDAPHRLHGRPAVAPSSDAPRRHHPYHLAADRRPLHPSDAPDLTVTGARTFGAPRSLHPSDSPRRFPSDLTVTGARPLGAPRSLHPSDAPRRLPSDPMVTGARPLGAPRRFSSDPTLIGPATPYNRLAAPPSFPLGPYKPPRCFSSDPTIIPGAGAPSCHSSSHLPVWHDRTNRNREEIVCTICNRRRNHGTLKCPFLLLAFDGFINSPPDYIRYRYFVIEKTQGIHGCGVGFYRPLCLEDRERIPADAMRLHKDGINLVRITNMKEDTSEPDLLYDLFVKCGPVSSAIVFVDKALAFVNFVREEDAQRAIKELNSCGFGYLMWATDSPETPLL